MPRPYLPVGAAALTLALSGCGFLGAGADEPPYFDPDSNRPLTGGVDVGAWTTRGPEGEACLFGWVRPGEESPAWRAAADAAPDGAAVTDVRFFLAPGESGRGGVPHWYVATAGPAQRLLLRDDGDGPAPTASGATTDTLRAALPRTAAGCLPS